MGRRLEGDRCAGRKGWRFESLRIHYPHLELVELCPWYHHAFAPLRPLDWGAHNPKKAAAVKPLLEPTSINVLSHGNFSAASSSHKLPGHIVTIANLAAKSGSAGHTQPLRAVNNRNAM